MLKFIPPPPPEKNPSYATAPIPTHQVARVLVLGIMVIGTSYVTQGSGLWSCSRAVIQHPYIIIGDGGWCEGILSHSQWGGGVGVGVGVGGSIEGITI